jgi:uncharacterized protein (TIGR02246 family)
MEIQQYLPSPQRFVFKHEWTRTLFRRKMADSMKRRTSTVVLYGLTVFATATLLFAETKTPATADARKAVDAVNQEIVRACQQRDLTATAALWADDGVDLLPGLAPMVGKAKISAWLESLRPQLEGSQMKYCTIDWQDIQIHDNVAYEWGINRQLIEFQPPKKSSPNEGKILFILKLQTDGQWKIALEAWNSNPQPQPAQ